MGQQQLLLLVLGVVIVGLAVVVGIQAFTENQQKSEIDRYVDQGVAMSGDIVAFYLKPTAQGGAGRNADALGDLAISDLGYREDRTDTWNGFERAGVVENGVVRYVGASDTHPFLHIHRFPQSPGDPRVEVHVFGPSPNCVVTRSDIYEVSPTWSDGKADNEAPDAPAGCSW